MDQLPDTWASRDFPFLLEAARRLDAVEPNVWASRIAAEAGLDEHQALAAALALHPTHSVVEPMWRGSGIHDAVVIGLTERGRRAVGLWPGEDDGDALIRTLVAAADMAPDPAQQGKLRKAAKALGGVSKDFLVEVTAAMATRQMTGGA